MGSTAMIMCLYTKDGTKKSYVTIIIIFVCVYSFINYKNIYIML